MSEPTHSAHAHGHHAHADRAHGADHGTSDAVSPEFAAEDPVCGMTVDTRSALAHEHAGRRYYFCGARCRDRFAAAPAKFLDDAAPAPAKPEPKAATGGAEQVWTCPMHPEIRRPGPGACPICGMALEPLAPSA